MQNSHLRFQIAFSSILALFSLGAHAQQSVPSTAKSIDFAELSISAAKQKGSYALAYTRNWAPGAQRKFRFGVGLRYTGFLAKNQDYATAPATLTSKMQGPQVLFSKIYYENIDTLVLDNSNTHSLNVLVNLQYTFAGKLDLGFNIDALGYTYGRRQIGTFNAKSTGTNKYDGARQTGRATPFNALLVSDNDWGTLNSEIYLRYHLNPKWAVRAGATFLFSEYTADRNLAFENDRFRTKALMGMIGISYSPFEKHR